MGCRLVLGVLGVFGVFGLLAVSSSVGWAAEGDSAPSDSDLMFEAMKQWRGESSSDSAAVERLLAAAKRESRRRRESILHGATSAFFRDPFADDPEKLIPVRREDRDLLDNLREGSRARAEMLLARNEAAAARADADAAKAEAARAEKLAARAEALAAKRQAAATQDGCLAPAEREDVADGRTDADGSSTPDESAGGPPVRHARRVRSHRRPSGETAAIGQPIAGAERDRSSMPPDHPAPASVDESTNRPPTGWTSADSRGILVVPIEVSISHGRKSAQRR
jgi:hypothetical protein